jgi:FkbM family methyltransferase
MASQLFAQIARPYIRAELPGWGRLYKRTIGGHEAAADWAEAGRRMIRDKRYGLYRVLDIAEWADRSFYFLGRWYDLRTALAIETVLRPGDRVVDVGGNYGHFALAAAACVGAGGHVISVEPNPEAFSRLTVHKAINMLKQIDIHNIGLSDSPGELELSVPRINSGEASFAPSAYADTTCIRCPVRTLDALVDAAPVDLIKIDVEGFETRVLDGAREVLGRDRPLVITEVVSAHLARAGATPGDLFARLEPLGYRPYRLGLRRQGMQQTLTLTPQAGDGPDGDLIWVPEARRDRLAGFLPGA